MGSTAGPSTVRDERADKHDRMKRRQQYRELNECGLGELRVLLSDQLEPRSDRSL